MKKSYLLSPGPTPVPPSTLLRMSAPVPHHRTAEFEAVFAEVRKGLQGVFQTRGEVLVLTSSGTGAMEGAVANMLCRGDKALVVRGGKFGERWAEICKAYGVQVVPIEVEWGRAVDPAAVAKALDADPSIRAVYVQASETSTGVAHPIEGIARAVRGRAGTILVVDAITGIGVMDLKTDDWGLDVVVAGSQKALMLPPGLAFASVSEKAWGFAERADLPRFYFDFRKERKNQAKNQSAFTPAITLMIGLADALKQILDEGIEDVFHRHAILAEATRAGAIAMGLELFAPDAPSPAVTAIRAPEGVDGGAIVKTLRARHGVIVAGGQDGLKGKIIRIAHLGYFDALDIVTALAALELALKHLGWPVSLGRGVGAAEEVLARL